MNLTLDLLRQLCVLNESRQLRALRVNDLCEIRRRIDDGRKLHRGKPVADRRIGRVGDGFVKHRRDLRRQPLGTEESNPTLIAYPGRATSATVGRSGDRTFRVGPVEAMGTSFFASTNEATTARVTMMKSVCSPATDVPAAASPLCLTMVKSTPLSFFSSSAARCGKLPLAVVAALILPGCFRISANSSGSVVMLRLVRVATMKSLVTTCVIGSRSVTAERG